MTINRSNHPCFNDKAKHIFGRVHLPVAPDCNIQCNFCNRKYDCVNESRPGVTSALLSPYQALHYLEYVIEKNPAISVVGIAGPGDPFANAEETMKTLELIREKYPEIILCLSTNGLNINPYIERIAELNVSHVTITVNAVDFEVGVKIYSWIRYQKKIYNPDKGFEILLDNQLKAISSLKERGVAVKVNSVIIPGINDHHLENVAKRVSKLGADIMNCIPYYTTKGTVFENIKEPFPESVLEIREKASKYISQMRHCVRCRADAVGLLGKDNRECYKILKKYSQKVLVEA